MPQAGFRQACKFSVSLSLPLLPLSRSFSLCGSSSLCLVGRCCCHARFHRPTVKHAKGVVSSNLTDLVFCLLLSNVPLVPEVYYGLVAASRKRTARLSKVRSSFRRSPTAWYRRSSLFQTGCDASQCETGVEIRNWRTIVGLLGKRVC